MTSRDPGIQSDLQLSQAASLAPRPQERSHVERSACRRHRAATLIADSRPVDYLQVIARALRGSITSLRVSSSLPLRMWPLSGGQRMRNRLRQVARGQAQRPKVTLTRLQLEDAASRLAQVVATAVGVPATS